MRKNSLIDKFTKFVSTSSCRNILILSTLFVVVSSVPIVYFLAYIFGEQYTQFMLMISIVMPLILTPVSVWIILKLTLRLNNLGHYLDIEIQKNKEKDLMLFEQARFAFMGEMMANVSHQWKQPLNTVGLAIVSIRASQKIVDSELDKKFDIMEDNISYLASTINDFMSFFDKRTHLELRDVEEIIKEIKSIMSISLSESKITFNLNYEKKDNIHITSSISQVVLNLLSNAKEALKDSKNKTIDLNINVIDDKLHIECYDNGKGVDPEIVDKIFDPYFTTKDRTVGTGIGLHMSKQIIQKVFDGKLYLDTSQRSLTCFRIEIPCSKNCVLTSEYIKGLHDTKY
jgi:signal transduction histidine kinase